MFLGGLGFGACPRCWRRAPAAYARLRGLNRSTVSRQIRDGKIQAPGGMIDPAAADRARAENLDGIRHAQATARKVERAAKAATTPNELIRSVAAKCWKTPEEKPAPPVHRPAVASGTEAHAAVVAVLRRIVAPTEVLRFAAVALRLGCSASQAYSL